MKIILISFMIVFLAACGGSANNLNAHDASIISFQGVAQKGSFEIGSVVTAYQLDENGLLTGKSRTAEVVGEQGNFTSKLPRAWMQNDLPIQLEVAGFFLDESTGQKSKEEIHLISISKNTTLNSVNLLTDWSSRRARALIKKGITFDDAITQSNKELLKIFGISNIQQLDISQNKSFPADNALLLLLSGALMDAADRYQVSSQVIIDDIAQDFSADGNLSGKGNDWFLRMQAVIRDNPVSHLRQYAKAIKNSNALDENQLPKVIPLASRPVAIVPKEIFAEPGETIILDGSASHNSGNLINITWFRVDQKIQFDIPISNRFSDAPTITTPDVETELSFLIVITNEQKLTDTAVIKVIVRKPPPKNKPPIADPQSVETEEDIPINITLTGSDADPKDIINFVITTPLQLPNGILEGTAPNLKYRPTKNFFGADSFTFMVNDGFEYSEPTTVEIIVKPINDPPVADAVEIQTDEDTSISILLTGSDVDSDDVIHFVIDNTSMNGVLEGTAPNLKYIPTKNFFGTDSFTFRVNDGSEYSELAKVNIIVKPVNDPPVADAGEAQSAFPKQKITLSGAGRDPEDGTNVTYFWTASEAVILDKVNIAKPTFTVPTTGIFPRKILFTLKVYDKEKLESLQPATVSINIKKKNQRPIANAGRDKTTHIRKEVKLDGTQSYDSDFDKLTFQWIFTSLPVDSSAVLKNPTKVNSSFIVDFPGIYVARLVVNDGTENSVFDEVKIIAVNSKPIAKAGDDKTVAIGKVVKLDGSGSTDADGDILNYSWTLSKPSTDSTAKLINPFTATPHFTIDLPGDYIAQLIVNDGTDDSEPAQVKISTVNSKPIAKIRNIPAVFVNSTVSLNARDSSDPDNDSLEYLWEFIKKPVGSVAIIGDSESIETSFRIDESGAYVLKLTVRDTFQNTDSVTLEITTDNTQPVADAGNNQDVGLGIATFNGADSFDVDHDELTYEWSLLDAPSGSAARIARAIGTTRTLLTPKQITTGLNIDLPGDYTAQLIVNDGKLNSEPDTVTYTYILKLVAKIGSQGVDLSSIVRSDSTDDAVEINGFGSTIDGGTTDNESLDYTWAIVDPNGSDVTSFQDNGNYIRFVPSQIGTYTISLKVSDGVNSSEIAVTNVTVIGSANTIPVADAGSDQSGILIDTEINRVTVELNGSDSSDNDGDTLFFSWSLTAPDGTDATSELDFDNKNLVGFPPRQYGVYIAKLIVNDGLDNSPADTVTIEVINQAPTANAGPPQTVAEGATTVSLSGEESSDREDGSELVYEWTSPDEVTFLSDDTTATPSFTAPFLPTDSSSLELEFSLRVIDTKGLKSPLPSSKVIITVVPSL